MAKFKVGDKVAYYGKESAIYRQRGRVSDVSQIRGDTFVTVDLDNGEEWGAPEKDWGLLNSRACSSVRSTNAVVAKALNACAKNVQIDDIKVGDRVMVRGLIGFTPTEPKPGKVTAIYKHDHRIAVEKDDGGRGLYDASMVTKNACGTARNAVVARNTQGDALSDGESLLEEAVKRIDGATGYVFSGWVDKETMAAGRKFNAKIKDVVRRLRPLVGEVEKLRREADDNYW